MKPSKRPASEDAEASRRFLETGVESYIDAVTAIVEYRRIIVKSCKELLRKHLAEYSIALGFTLAPEDIREFVDPKLDEWDGSLASLGGMIVDVDRPPGLSWWMSYCCIYWERTDASRLWCGPCVGISLDKKKQAAELLSNLRRAGITDLKSDSNDVWLVADLNADHAADFEEPLDQLLVRWIAAIKKIGGLKALVTSE